MSAGDRLYNLLPAVYRVRDSAQGEPLRALFTIIETQLDAIDDDLTNLYENWFVETCQEWVAPYIGDLLGVRGLKPISGGAFTARPYVAHTLKYRRSKGTAAMLEGMAHDVTNWPARVVEFFQLLETTQNVNHLRLQNLATPDFRDTNALELLDGSFEQASRTLDVRSPEDGSGKYNVPNVGIFLWRLESYRVTQAAARPVTDGTDGRFRFNPFALDAPLFNQPAALTEGARVTSEAQVPGPLRRRALYDDLEAVSQAKVDANPQFQSAYFDINPVVEVVVAGAAVPTEQMVICDLSDLPSPPGGWPTPPSTQQYIPTTGAAINAISESGNTVTLEAVIHADWSVPAVGDLLTITGVVIPGYNGTFPALTAAVSGTTLTATYSCPHANLGPDNTGHLFYKVTKPSAVSVDPALGRLFFAAGSIPGDPSRVQANYSYGFSGNIGGGPYDRNSIPQLPAGKKDPTRLTVSKHLTADFTSLADAINTAGTGWNAQGPGARFIIAVLDSEVYAGNLSITVPEDSFLLIVAAEASGSQLEPANVRPVIVGNVQVTGTASPNSQAPGGLLLDGLLIDGSVIVEPGNLGSLQLTDCTVRPVSGSVQVAAQVQGSGASSSIVPAALVSPPPPPSPLPVKIPVTTPVLRITSTSPLPTATVGTAFTVTLAATGGTGLTWSATGLPSWLSLSAGGVLKGTPPAAGSFSFNVSVETDTTSANKTFTLPVAAALAVTTTSPLPSATAGSAYSVTLAATGGTGADSWVAAGLPSWLTLSSAGVLTGVPPDTGSDTFTVTVTDSGGATKSASFALTIVPPPLVIATTQLPATITGVSYNQTLQGKGGKTPLSWSIVSGALPDGVTLAAATGVISGTPAAAGSFTFTVQLSDSAGTAPAKQALTIVVATGLAITTAPALPPVTINTAYSETLTASGGTGALTWAITTGALPTGLTLNAATGAITGTPKVAGSFSFTAKVTDSKSVTATQAFTLTIAATPTIGATSLPNATEGAAYTRALAVTGGTAPLAWSVSAGALPAGIHLDAATGALTGNPTASGSFSFTVEVKDSSAATATQNLALVVAPPLAITTGAQLPAGTAGVAYSQSLATSGGTQPLAWSVISGSLPPGLSLSSAGVLSGTATDAASSVFTAQVKDGTGASAAVTFSLTMAPALIIAIPAVPEGEINQPYSGPLIASGGTPPYSWSLQSGSLPAGLQLVASGSIQGTPTAVGSTSVTLKCSDSNSVTVTGVFQVTIAPAPTIATAATLPAGVSGSKYSLALAVSGGVAPFIWSVTAEGGLPPGITVGPHGSLEGVPETAGTFTMTLAVTDAAGGSSSERFTISIIDDNPVLAVSLTRSICGPLSLDAATQLTIVDSVIDPGTDPEQNPLTAIAAPLADASIETSTILGTIGSPATGGSSPINGVRTLQAGNSIFSAPLFVERRQAGCIRFCFVPSGSRTPRRYRSQPDLALKNVVDALQQAAILARLQPAFTSLVFGQPGYAQLSPACAPEIQTGAEDGAEMGVFNFLKQPQRQDNLLASLDEFLRFGLEAGIFFVT